MSAVDEDALRRALPLLGPCLDAIDSREDEVRAFTDGGFDHARLLGEAGALLRRWPDPVSRPPLFGVPLGVKDIFRVEGRAIRAGSRLPAEAFAGPEADAVTRLKQAGALVMGITVTAEFACWAPGPTRNPRNLGHTPGGSSSGSAAGTAAGFFAVALGSQTAGSVIRPAAFCGVIGVKPTFGRIAPDGMVPYAPSLDHVGLFADSLDHAEAALAVLVDGWRRRTAPAQGALTLGVPSGGMLDKVAPRARAVFEAALARLRGAGWRLVEAPFLADVEAICTALDRLSQVEAAAVHRERVVRYGVLIHPSTMAEIRAGQAIAAAEADALRALQRKQDAEAARATAAAGIDLWLTPAATDRAPEGLGATGDPAMNSPWTFIGWPALTLPCAFDGDGLAYGLQVAAPAGRDEALVAAARLLQEAVSP